MSSVHYNTKKLSNEIVRQFFLLSIKITLRSLLLEPQR